MWHRILCFLFGLFRVSKLLFGLLFGLLRFLRRHDSIDLCSVRFLDSRRSFSEAEGAQDSVPATLERMQNSPRFARGAERTPPTPPAEATVFAGLESAGAFFAEATVPTVSAPAARIRGESTGGRCEENEENSKDDDEEEKRTSHRQASQDEESGEGDPCDFQSCGR